MLMTVLMNDAVLKLPASDQALMKDRELMELVYADDTLLLSASADCLERFLAAVARKVQFMVCLYTGASFSF